MSHPRLRDAEGVEIVSRPRIVFCVANHVGADGICVDVENGNHLMVGVTKQGGSGPVLGNFSTPLVLSIEILTIARVNSAHVV